MSYDCSDRMTCSDSIAGLSRFQAGTTYHFSLSVALVSPVKRRGDGQDIFSPHVTVQYHSYFLIGLDHVTSPQRTWILGQAGSGNRPIPPSFHTWRSSDLGHLRTWYRLVGVPLQKAGHPPNLTKMLISREPNCHACNH